MTHPETSAATRSRRVLGLFAKQPVPGQVKTRLAAARSADWAARVAEAFLLDTIERLATMDARRVLAFAPPQAHPFFHPLVRGRFVLIPQGEGDLGHRMAAFFDEQFQTGAKTVVLAGTDSPTLPLALIEQAFTELDRAEVVLGPATDGGYYLIGCSGCMPSLFEGVSWSTSRVLLETVLRVKEAARRLAILPPWYDVDTVDDWRMLRGHVAAMRHAGLDQDVPRTELLLQDPIP